VVVEQVLLLITVCQQTIRPVDLDSNRQVIQDMPRHWQCRAFLAQNHDVSLWLQANSTHPARQGTVTMCKMGTLLFLPN
jgi:hypothetical protein